MLLLILAFVLNMWIHNGWLSALIGIVAEAGLTAAFILNTEAFDNLLGNTLSSISIVDRYSNFALGIFDVSALIYYISVSFLFVFITIQRIKKKRWN